MFSTDWVKYEALISISSNYSALRDQSTIGYEMEGNISTWLNSRDGLSALSNVDVRFHTPREHFNPQQLQIHLHGPPNLEDKMYSALRVWMADRNTFLFRRKIPLLRDTLVIRAMSRIKYKVNLNIYRVVTKNTK